MRSVNRFILTLFLAFWLGGLTFYALVVVPVGTRLLGSDQQGLITQQVTNYLNTAGVVTGLLLVVHAINTRHWALLACFGVFAAAQAGLLFMHVRLDRMLSGDVTGFYDVHRVYLLITAIQWLAGMAALWFILQKTRSCPELPTS